MATSGKSRRKGTHSRTSRQQRMPRAQSLSPDGLAALIDVQKRALETAVRQNATALDALGNIVSLLESQPAAAVLDRAEQTMSRLAEAEKRVLDVIIQQGGLAVYALTAAHSHFASGTAENIQKGIQAIAELQKTMLELAAKQHGLAVEVAESFGIAARQGVTAFDAAKEAAMPIAGELAELAQTGIETLLGAPKRLLEIARSGVKKGAAGTE